MVRALLIVLVPIATGCFSSVARAQVRWVDDEHVLAARRVRLSAGVGYSELEYSGFWSHGTGLNLEEAFGIGHGLELGARFGLRPDQLGRGLRADELARGADTETFGTGISITANPELRLRWRFIRWSWGEASAENRAVLPIQPDPDFTEGLGARASARFAGIGRVDVGVNGILTWRSIETGHVVEPGLSVPVQVWFNVTRGLFVGALSSTRTFAATSVTSGATRVLVGLGVGYRLGPCELLLGAYLPDVVNDGTDRRGVGLTFAWTM